MRSTHTVRSVAMVALVAFMSTLCMTPQSSACTPESKARKIRKALARGDLLAACRAIRQFRSKYPLTPLPPGSPSDDDCDMAGQDSTGNGGRGRGGGMAGAGPAGGGIGGRVFIFNGGNPTNCFYYEIVPDLANPPGFMLPFPSGAVNVPTGTTATVPFTVTVAPGVPDGTCAFFDVVITDCGNGEDIPGDYQRVKITVLNGLAITITQSNFDVVDGVKFTAKWNIRNLDPAPKIVPYTFTMTPDPGSMPELNGGGHVDIPDGFSCPRAAAGGGAAALAAAGSPGDSADISWDMAPGEYCDPAMISCCALEIGVATCSQCFVNVADTSLRPCCPGSPFLIQGVTQGGSVDLLIDGQPLSIPTVPGLNAQQVVDLIATEVATHAHNTDNFDFAADPQYEEIVIARQGGLAVQMIRNDPGLRITDLPSFSAYEYFDIRPLGPGLRCEPLASPAHVDVEIIALSLNSIAPITVVAQNSNEVSPSDVGGINNLQGRMVTQSPIYLTGNIIQVQIDIQFTSNLPTLAIGGPPQLDFDPLFANMPAFNVHLPLQFGGAPDAQMFLEVIPTAFDGVNEVPIPLNPGSINAFPTSLNTIRVVYQSQALAPLFELRHQVLVAGSVLNFPPPCPFLLGDVNQDGEVSSLDIQGFVECVVSFDPITCACADMNSDGTVDGTDVSMFVTALLN